MKVKVGYLMAQQQGAGFGGNIPVSYAAIQKQKWKDIETSAPSIYPDTLSPKEKEGICFYFDNEMNELFDQCRDCNIIVLFNVNYMSQLLDKYYVKYVNEMVPFHHDYPIFDLQGMIYDETDKYISLDELGRSKGIPRLVSNGMAMVDMWKKGDMLKMRRCMMRDMDILISAFTTSIMSTRLKAENYNGFRSVSINTAGWHKVFRGIAKLTFNERRRTHEAGRENERAQGTQGI